MGWLMHVLEFVLAAAFSTATPLVFAALGELVAEKSGVLNLSVEGMMALAAAISFMVTTVHGSHFLGFLAGGFVAMLLSAVFAILVLVFIANQVAAGLAVGILGLGLSALLGHAYEGTTLVPLAEGVGTLSVSHSGFGFYPVYAGLRRVSRVWHWHRSRLVPLQTKSGLILRVIGEIRRLPIRLAFRRFQYDLRQSYLVALWPVSPAPTHPLSSLHCGHRE